MAPRAGPELRTLPERLGREGLQMPSRLTVAVTGACNLRCGHCYVEGSPEAESQAPSVQALLDLVAELGELGGREVCLTGGEPLVRRDWRDLLSAVCADTDLDAVRLQTNATLLDARSARAIASLNCGRLTVQVSLDGATQDTHDRVRGAGSFERATRGIEALTQCGLAGQVEVAFTEMRHNIEELPALLEWLEERGVRRLTSASVTPHGRVRSSAHLAPPTPGQYTRLLERYLTDARFHARCLEWAQVAAFRWWEGRESSSGSSCSLVRNPYVGPDGRLYPCPLLHDPALAVDDAYPKGLARAVSEGLCRWADLQRTSLGRGRTLSECRGCPGQGHCGGGCMGRAFLAWGTCGKPEDRCALRRAIYAGVSARP